MRWRRLPPRQRFRGRLQLLDGDPPTVLDGAHNPDAVAALVRVASRSARPARAPLALVLGVLEDKDAAAMLGDADAAASSGRGSPRRPSSRALSPAALQSLARQLGFEATVCEPRPARALEQARRWAREHAGAVLVTGSVYLVGELLGRLERSESAPTELAASQELRQMSDDGPSVLTMIGAVALIVALVILVFFAAGYGFGRLFL